MNAMPPTVPPTIGATLLVSAEEILVTTAGEFDTEEEDDVENGGAEDVESKVEDGVGCCDEEVVEDEVGVGVRAVESG